MIEKIRKIINQYDFYQSLLTEKQRKYIESYYEDDLSLAEVAEKFNVSRNAVHDNLKRVEILLDEYECKLNLVEKYQRRSKLIEDIKSNVSEDVHILLDELEDI
ncbi:YlxM family DNA-binding protein [Mycoplasmatota bacterium WC44]